MNLPLSSAQGLEQARQRGQLHLLYLFELETEQGILFPTYHGAGDINGTVVIGPDIKL